MHTYSYYCISSSYICTQCIWTTVYIWTAWKTKHDQFSDPNDQRPSPPSFQNWRRRWRRPWGFRRPCSTGFWSVALKKNPSQSKKQDWLLGGLKHVFFLIVHPLGWYDMNILWTIWPNKTSISWDLFRCWDAERRRASPLLMKEKKWIAPRPSRRRRHTQPFATLFQFAENTWRMFSYIINSSFSKVKYEEDRRNQRVYFHFQ